MKNKKYIVLMMISLCFSSFASEFSVAVEESIKANEEKWIIPLKEDVERKKNKERWERAKIEVKEEAKLHDEWVKDNYEKAVKSHEAKIAAAEKDEKRKEEEYQKLFQSVAKNADEVLSKMKKDPDGHYMYLNTKVSRALYNSVMPEKRRHQGWSPYPTTYVSIIDAIDFCNELSLRCGLKPCYKNAKLIFFDKDGKKIKKEEYLKALKEKKITYKNAKIKFECKWDKTANGFYIPTLEQYIKLHSLPSGVYIELDELQEYMSAEMCWDFMVEGSSRVLWPYLGKKMLKEFNYTSLYLGAKAFGFRVVCNVK